MKQLAVICAALVAVACPTSSQAEAGKIGYSYGTYVGSSTGGYSYTASSYYPAVMPVRTPVVVTRPVVVHPRRSVVWHNTSHWDYVPASVSFGPAGLRYNPGRYVWHEDGHYDTIRHGHHHH